MVTALETMTSRQRWLAALDMEPVDRLPFWPKIGGNYAPAQAEPFCNMSVLEIHEWIGSDRHEGVGSGIRETFDGWEVERAEHVAGDHKTVHRTFRGPDCELTSVDGWEPTSMSWHPVELPVKCPGDIKHLTDYYAACTVELDEEQAAAAVKRQEEIGETASTSAWIGTSALMDWVQHLAGPVNCHYFLADYPDPVRALFAAMHTHMLQRVRVAAEHCPADTIYISENTSTTLISPQQYTELCFPDLREYGEILTAHGKRMVLHMCGYLKDLLPQIAKVPAAAYEAFTSPPLANTTLLDGRAACPNVCLVGGTCAPLWLKPAEEIIETLQRDLDELPHHRGIVVTSAGVMPPAATPETIKAVADWVKAYPARM